MVAYFLGKRFCKFSVNIAVLGTCQTVFDSSLSSCGCNYNPVLWFCVQMALEQHLLAPRPSCSLILANYQDGKRACRSAAPRICFTYKESESWQIMTPEQQTHGQGWPPKAHWIFMTLLCTNIDPHAPRSMAKDMASFYRHQYRINENRLLKLWDDSSRPQLVEGFRMRKQRKEAKWSLAIGWQPCWAACFPGMWTRSLSQADTMASSILSLTNTVSEPQCFYLWNRDKYHRIFWRIKHTSHCAWALLFSVIWVVCLQLPAKGGVCSRWAQKARKKRKEP